MLARTALFRLQQERGWRPVPKAVLLRWQTHNNNLHRINILSRAEMLFRKTSPCIQICAHSVSQFSHTEGCSILYHWWINILRKPWQAAYPTINSTLQACCRSEWIDLPRWNWRNAALMVKQSLSGGCPHNRCQLPYWYSWQTKIQQ